MWSRGAAEKPGFSNRLKDKRLRTVKLWSTAAQIHFASWVGDQKENREWGSWPKPELAWEPGERPRPQAEPIRTGRRRWRRQAGWLEWVVWARLQESQRRLVRRRVAGHTREPGAVGPET